MPIPKETLAQVSDLSRRVLSEVGNVFVGPGDIVTGSGPLTLTVGRDLATAVTSLI